MPKPPMSDWSKDELEAEKLRRELRTPWVWRNIQTIVTCIVGVLGLVYAAKTDLFEVQSQQLKLDIDLFTAKRDSLHHANDELLATNQVLLGDRNRLLAERSHQDSLAREAALAARRAEAALLPVKERASYMERAIAEINAALEAEKARATSMNVDLMTQKYGYDKLLADKDKQIGMLMTGNQGLQERLDNVLNLKLPNEKDRNRRGWTTVANMVRYYEPLGWKEEESVGERNIPQY